MCRTLCRRGLLALAAGAVLPGSPGKRIVFVAGRKSHAYGCHAHYAGCLFLAKCLKEAVPGVETAIHRDGWPADASVFDGADAVVYFADGGDRNPILPHLDALARLTKRGAGIAVLHYALCVPKGEPGDRLLDAIGGYYETHWSVNPSWTARFETLPEHPITLGVRPFAIFDEWYYHMRFREDMAGVTPLLTAVPPERTRERPFGPHSGNPVVKSRKGMPEHLAWAYERPGGGRGFGFAGLHFHWAFEHDDFRRLLVNAVAWIAGIGIPPSGLRSATPTWEDLLAGQEGQMPDGFTLEQARQAVRPRSE